MKGGEDVKERLTERYDEIPLYIVAPSTLEPTKENKQLEYEGHTASERTGHQSRFTFV